MLSSRRLRTALFLFICLTCQNLFAADLRYYLILQVGEGESHSYIGSVTINDDIQALAAQIFFPGGHVVFIEMDIQADGVTVNLQINPNGQAFVLTPLTTPLISPFVQALQSGSGAPSDWLAVPALTEYHFQLSAVSRNNRVLLNKLTKNSVGDVNIRFNRKLPPEIRSPGWSYY